MSGNYAIRRLLLLPFTLFFIVLVNFTIINLAPGDPSSFTEISQEGMASRREGRSSAFGGDERYVQFREFYGLTLPILFNNWPFLTRQEVQNHLQELLKPTPAALSPKEWKNKQTLMGDQARFVMPHLLAILKDPSLRSDLRALASQFFVRGALKLPFLGPTLTPEEKKWNARISQTDAILRPLPWSAQTSSPIVAEKAQKLSDWYQENRIIYQFEPTWKQKIKLFFFETRFTKYMSRVLHLDFGTLRNDPSKTVLNEVTKRLKYSLTLSLIPLVISFFFCQFFGLWMAVYHTGWAAHLLSLFFLILYATPVFVVAPLLIETLALNHTFPWSSTPIPISGFTSPETIYAQQTSWERLVDILEHLFLPLIALLYGSLALQSRISRTAFLEVLKQDFVRTARAKGAPPSSVLYKHAGRNAAITITTSVAGSLGVLLGGSLIVETLFDIHGFGKFFYEAVLNRDYNVIMFSTLVGSFLTLTGYLVADFVYMWLDPRVRLE